MLVAISQRREKNKYGFDIDSLESSYVDYLKSFRIELLPIPNSARNIEEYFNSIPLKGLILSGGNDISPKFYGQQSRQISTISEIRDAAEKNMLENAIIKKVPVMGICRGTQFIWTYFGGKLVENLEEITNEKHAGAKHDIIIFGEKATKFKKINTRVNSFHNQGIIADEVPDQLDLFAKTISGSIEGIYHRYLPIFGIMWHPERNSPDTEINEKLIKAFLNGGVL